MLRRTLVELRASGRAAWQALLGLQRGDDLAHAGAIAYYSLLSLFPFLLLLMSVIGTVTNAEADRSRALAFVLRYLPGQAEFITTQLDAARDTRLGVGLVGALVLLWASLGVFSAVTRGVNAAWGVKNRPNFLKHRLMSFLTLLSAGAFVLAAVLLAGAVQVVETTWFGGLVTGIWGVSTVQSFIGRYAATLLLILGVGLLFYFVPNARVRFRDVWVGAIVTGLLWRGALWGFSQYVERASQLAVIHGSLTTVVVFLLWI